MRIIFLLVHGFPLENGGFDAEIHHLFSEMGIHLFSLMGTVPDDLGKEFFEGVVAAAADDDDTAVAVILISLAFPYPLTRFSGLSAFVTLSGSFSSHPYIKVYGNYRK